MKLASKKNGLGYVTAYYISFGCKEARKLKLINEDGNIKEIESAELVDENSLKINFKKI